MALRTSGTKQSCKMSKFKEVDKINLDFEQEPCNFSIYA